MTRYKPILTVLAFVSILLLFWACKDQYSDTLSSTALVNSLETKDSPFSTNRNFPTASEKLPSFCIIYEGDLETLLADDAPLIALMDEYNLVVKNPFEVDDVYQGIILESFFPLNNAVHLGKILSVVPHVVMLEIVNADRDFSEDYL